MAITNRFLYILLACEGVIALLLSVVGLFNILYFEYVPATFFAGAVLLTPVLLYSYVARPVQYPKSDVLLLLSACLLFLGALAPVLVNGLFTAQFFGLIFEPTTAAALFIGVVHLLTFVYLRAQAVFSSELCVHALGLSSVAVSVLQFAAGSPDYAYTSLVFVFWYATYCAFKIDHQDVSHVTVTWIGFVAVLLACIAVPFSGLFGLFGIVLMCTAFACWYRPTDYFAGPLLIAAVGVVCVFSFINPDRLHVTQAYVVPIDWVPAMFVRTVVQEPDMKIALFGRGPTTATNVWLTQQPSSHFTTSEFKGDPDFIGSFASTHALTGGFVGVVVWLFFLGLLLARAWTLFTGSADNEKKYLSLLLVSVAGLFLFFAVTVTTLVLSMFALALSVDTGVAKKVSKGRSTLAGALAVVVLLVSLLLIKHTISIVFSYTYFSNGVREVVSERYEDALWFFQTAEDTRKHPDLLRTHAQLLNKMLTSELQSDDPSKHRIDELINAVLDLTDEAVVQNPFDYKNWLVVGNLHLTMLQMGVPGSGDKANAAYNEARAVAKHKIEIDYMLAQLALQQGLYDDAQNYLNILQKMYPEDEVVIEMTEYLQAQVSDE